LKLTKLALAEYKWTYNERKNKYTWKDLWNHFFTEIEEFKQAKTHQNMEEEIADMSNILDLMFEILTR